MRRFTFWAVALAILVIVVFNVQGWLVLRRTNDVLRTELGDRLQGLATTLSSMLGGRYEEPGGRRLISDVMTSNKLFNVFIVNESLEYVLNTREPARVGQTDPALELDATEILSAFSGIATQSKLYAAGGYYLASAYAPLEASPGLVTAVIAVEADARYFSVLAGFRNSLLLINGLSLIAIIAIVLVSVSLARHALRIEQAAARANTMALMGQMSGAMAHEIKNPLGIIRAAAERLQRNRGWESAPTRAESGERPDPGSSIQELEYIKEEVDRLNRVISNYLSLGATRPGEIESVSLAELIPDVLAGIDHETRRQGISVEVSLDSLPPVKGNRIELRQAFLNLALNACQAQPDGGLIQVTGRFEGRGARGEGWVVVEVTDHGPGIKPQDRSRIFEPFFTTKEKGSGLGLFVVRRVIEAHHGKVSILDRPEKGTTVEVRLPA